MVGKPGLVALVIVCWAPGIGFAEAEDPTTQRSEATSTSVCLLVESAAKANHLPVEFFARVIWQESRFQVDAVGPRTRGGDRAQGIAQFMPRTAAERGLLDPFDPIQALPESARFLAELRAELSAGFSREKALRSYAAIANRYHAALAGHDPSILASRLLSRGTRTFYQIRVGATTRVAADALCDKIRRLGGACVVMRTRA